MNNEEIIKRQQEQERQDGLEHRDVLLAIAALLKRPEGLTLFKYLFKNLDVTKLPEQDMEGNVLHDYLGFLRAGSSIYKLACEADSDIAASILAKLERERYDKAYEQYRLENGLDNTNGSN